MWMTTSLMGREAKVLPPGRCIPNPTETARGSPTSWLSIPSQTGLRFPVSPPGWPQDPVVGVETEHGLKHCVLLLSLAPQNSQYSLIKMTPRVTLRPTYCRFSLSSRRTEWRVSAHPELLHEKNSSSLFTRYL